MNRLFRTIGIITLPVFFMLPSCKNDGNNTGISGQDKIIDAGNNNNGVVLLIEEADLIQLENKPQYNTAEWLVKVEKPGRYDVWLSSLTVDTTHLLFAENVIITAGETKLEKKPLRDEIVTEDKSISQPWFRADSHMGSVLFAKPGEYPIQVISDRVERHTSDVSQISPEKHTLINSVILKPKVN